MVTILGYRGPFEFQGFREIRERPRYRIYWIPRSRGQTAVLTLFNTAVFVSFLAICGFVIILGIRRLGDDRGWVRGLVK